MRPILILAVLAFSTAGCNRQDADALGRIGKKVVDRTQTAMTPLRDRIDHTVKGLAGAAGIRERVQLRLRWDKALAETSIDVLAVDNEVELKGTLKSDELRRRAVEIAETTAGVGRVTNHLQIE